jgi:hypothetical protein
VSIQPTQARSSGTAAGGMGTRASDADRDRAARLLNAAFAEGRLTADEHGQRLDAAYAARTWQQLDQVTADLPIPPTAAVERMAPPGMFSRPDPCLLCALLILRPPAGIAWWLMSRRRVPAPPTEGPA